MKIVSDDSVCPISSCPPQDSVPSIVELRITKFTEHTPLPGPVGGGTEKNKLFEVKGQASKIYLGLWGRSNRTNVESIIGLFGIGFGKTTFMASYDYNTTFATREQYVTGRTNTFEFSIVHTFTPKVKPPLLEDNFIFNPRF